ncbi:hypothetical protein [Spirillospora sp. CA-294931]|uniref:hypothetical protein n=1 Tax=Spirillospora sp. CA-294931 TaxID=3240042 RepID=UPI003D94B8AB
MSAEQVDRFLHELGETVAALRADHESLESLAEQLDDEVEQGLELRYSEDGPPGFVGLEPSQTLLSLRRELAEESAQRHRDVVRGLTAWWADAALVAAESIIQGSMPDPTRMVAADPYWVMSAEDLARLPDIPESDRRLAELALSMATAPGPPRRSVLLELRQ